MTMTPTKIKQLSLRRIISNIAYVLSLNTEIEFRLTHNIIHLFNALSIVFFGFVFVSKMIDHRVMDVDLSV